MWLTCFIARAAVVYGFIAVYLKYRIQLLFAYNTHVMFQSSAAPFAVNFFFFFVVTKDINDRCSRVQNYSPVVETIIIHISLSYSYLDTALKTIYVVGQSCMNGDVPCRPCYCDGDNFSKNSYKTIRKHSLI